MVTPDPRMATELARLAAEAYLRQYRQQRQVFNPSTGAFGPGGGGGNAGASPTQHDTPGGFSPVPAGVGPAAGGGVTIGGGIQEGGSVRDLDDFFEGEQRRRRSLTLLGLRRLEYGIIDLGSVRPVTANGLFAMPAIADVRMADALMIKVRSTCNQAVTIQTVGNVANSPDTVSVFNIEASQALAAGSTTESVLALLINLRDNWAPYIGITVTAGATAPTTGFVFAVAHLRFWQHID